MAENFTLPLGNEFHIPASNHLVLPTVTLGVVFITVLVATIFTVFTINRYVSRCAKVRCDLCGEKIRIYHMASSHREECADLHRDYLRHLPSPFDIRCPICLTYLRLMPKNRGKRFLCDDSDCPVATGILNNGFNRLSCFACNYDLCDSCAHRRTTVLARFTFQCCNNSYPCYSNEMSSEVVKQAPPIVNTVLGDIDMINICSNGSLQLQVQNLYKELNYNCNEGPVFEGDIGLPAQPLTEVSLATSV